MSEKKGKDDGRDSLLLAIEPYTEMFIKSVMDHLADFRPVEAIIKDMSSISVAAVQAAPGAVGLAVSKIPDDAFKSPALANFVRGSVLEIVKRAAEVVREKRGEASSDEIGEAVKEGMKAVAEKAVLIDPLGHFHEPDCARLVNLFVGKGRKHPTMTFERAVKQGVKPSPCCIEWAKEELKRPPETEKKEKRENVKDGRKLSPLDIVGAMEEKDRKAFYRWLKGLDAEMRKFAMEALDELDSVEEFHGLMAAPAAMRTELLPLLRNRHGKHAVKEYLGALGVAVKAGWREMSAFLVKCWQVGKGSVAKVSLWLAEQDAALEPALKREQERAQRLAENARKPVKWSLKRIFSLT